MSQQSHLPDNGNSRIPNDYQPVPPQPPKFEAPAHNLDGRQREQVVELAESSHRAIGGSNDFSGTGSNVGGYSSQGQSGLAGVGSGSGHNSSVGDAARNVLGGGTGSVTQSHTGHPGNYELGQGDLSHNRTSLTGDSHSHGHSGAGVGSGIAAGGLAATAGAQGLGSGHHSSADSYNQREQYSSNQGQTSNREHSSSTSGSGLNTSANSGSGPTAPSGTLENKLQAELERNARKKGTHAAGPGTAGMSADVGNLLGEKTGVSNSIPSQGVGASGSSGHHSGLGSAAGVAGGVGAGGLASQGLHGSHGHGLHRGEELINRDHDKAVVSPDQPYISGEPNKGFSLIQPGQGQGLAGQSQGYAGQPGLGQSGLTGQSGLGQSGLTGQSGLGHSQGQGYTHGGQGEGLGARLGQEVENRAANTTGSSHVSGLGSAGVNQQHGRAL